MCTFRYYGNKLTYFAVAHVEGRLFAHHFFSFALFVVRLVRSVCVCRLNKCPATCLRYYNVASTIHVNRIKTIRFYTSAI